MEWAVADSSALIQQAAWILGAGGGGAAIASIVKGLVNGSSSQEQILRQGQSDEIKELRDEMRLLRAEQVQMRLELDGLRVRSLQLYSERETARLKLSLLEQKHGETPTVWPADPPTGGAP